MSGDFLPVLIVGAERSGTNLLRALLSTHSKIASPPSAGIIDALGRIQSRYFPSSRPAYLSELIDDVVARLVSDGAADTRNLRTTATNFPGPLARSQR